MSCSKRFDETQPVVIPLIAQPYPPYWSPNVILAFEANRLGRNVNVEQRPTPVRLRSTYSNNNQSRLGFLPQLSLTIRIQRIQTNRRLKQTIKQTQFESKHK